MGAGGHPPGDLELGRPHEVPRLGLQERLRDRWVRSVTTIVAPGGFGKSTLVRQASDADQAWFGRTHAATCRPSSREAEALAELLATAIGAQPLEAGNDPVAHAERLLTTLAAWSPQRICLVIDDVHHLGQSGSGVELLIHLVRHLPGNAHLVLVGRGIPPLPLARWRAADQLLEFTEGDLLFDHAEMAELARRNGAPNDSFGDLPGWPALLRLALAAGVDAPLEYLREEVLESLDDDERSGIAAALLTGGADDQLLAAVAGGLTARQLAQRVPLIDHRDGRAVAHALWSAVMDRLIPGDRAPSFLDQVIGQLEADRRYDDAFHLAAEHQRWDLAARVAQESVAASALAVGAPTTRRWVRAIPRAEHDRPEFMLLRALEGRLDDRPTDAAAWAERARLAFVERGDEYGEATALGELAWARWTARDIPGILAVFDRARQLAPRFPGRLSALVSLVQAAIADLQGDPQSALDHLRSLQIAPDDDPGLQALAFNWEASLCVLVGDTAAGLEATRQAIGVSRRFGGRAMQVVLSHWFHGDPAGALQGLAAWGASNDDFAMRDRFLNDVYSTVIGASLGRIVRADHDELLRRGQGHGRDRTFAAVAAAAPLVVAGDEDAARELIVDVVRAAIDGDRLARNELLRFLPYPAVLVPDLASALSAGPLGPTHRVNQQLAALLVDLRAGRPISWSTLPPPGRVITSFPLPWTLEIAAAAHADAHPRGAEVLEAVMAHAGEGAAPVIDRLRADERIGPSLRALIDSQPATPPSMLEIRVLGPLEMTMDGEPLEGADAHRRRVRELLALLVVRGSITRESACTMLWPDLDPQRAANNLAQTLRRLRKVIEPTRARGEPAFFVRQRGDRLELTPSDQLRVDLWASRDAMERASFAEQSGDLASAAAALDAAVAEWRGEPLTDLRLVEGTLAERSAIELGLVDAACRAGELHLARHALQEARAVVERVLRLHSSSERAHRLAIAIELQANDHGAARGAFDRCVGVLGEAGIEVGEETLKIARPILPT